MMDTVTYIQAVASKGHRRRIEGRIPEERAVSIAFTR